VNLGPDGLQFVAGAEPALTLRFDAAAAARAANLSVAWYNEAAQARRGAARANAENGSNPMNLTLYPLALMEVNLAMLISSSCLSLFLKHRSNTICTLHVRSCNLYPVQKL
jgi:hypothetical protein